MILRETKECRINTIVFLIDLTKIKELTLLNTASTCVVTTESTEHIAQMVNLVVLRLFWVRDMTDMVACKMLRNLSALEELSLCEF